MPNKRQLAMFLPSAEGRSAVIQPHYADREDVPRLAGQNGKILALLRLGPATNRQLSVISMKYTSRISDLRDWLENNTGETIRCIRGSGGLNYYEIVKITSDRRETRPARDGRASAPLPGDPPLSLAQGSE